MNKKAFWVAAYSAFVQYYDYHLLGYLAAKIAKYFVPDSDHVVQLLNAYLIITLSVLAKPVGALFLGKIGDIYGRSSVFNISLIGIAFSSFIIAITPSYQQIGLASTLILLLARMSMCALVSTGIDSIRIYIYEHINSKKQCFGVGITAIFTQAGSLAASLSAFFFTLEILPDYSWRFAFILGSIMSVIAVYLKRKLKVKDDINLKDDINFKEFSNLSISRIIKKNFALFLYSIILVGAIGSTTQFITIFFGTYNFDVLKIIKPSTMQFYTSITIAVYMIFSLIAGYTADHIGRYKTVYIGGFLTILICFGHTYFLSKNQISLILFLSTTIALPFLTIPSAAILKESIPITIRYRIFSLAHAIGSLCISAPTAFISTLLYHKTHLTWLPIIYFFLAIIMILSSLIFLKKYHNKAK